MLTTYVMVIKCGCLFCCANLCARRAKATESPNWNSKRCIQLGCNCPGARAFGDAGGTKAAVASLKAKANAHAQDIAPIIADIRAAGATSLPAIAAELNARKIKSVRGGRWYAGTVANLLGRKCIAA